MNGRLFRTALIQTIVISSLMFIWLWLERWEVLTNIDLFFVFSLFVLTAFLSSLASAFVVKLLGRKNRSKSLLSVAYIVTGVVVWILLLVSLTKMAVWVAVVYSLEWRLNNPVQFLWSDYGSIFVAGLAFLAIAIFWLPIHGSSRQEKNINSDSKF